jgi:predicted transcriptional regulator
MTKSSAAVRPELVEKIGELARETGCTPDELEAAAREYAEYARWKEAKIQEALDELEAGGPTYSHEEVMAEIKALIEERIRAAAGK